MQRLVILTEAEGIPGPPAVDDPLISENLIEALGPTVDIAAIRSGRELRVIKNRSGACGMVRLSSDMEALLDGAWQGSLPLAEAGPPLPYSFETFLQWEGNRLAMEAARTLSIVFPEFMAPLPGVQPQQSTRNSVPAVQIATKEY
jgi:hypothetical protein